MTKSALIWKWSEDYNTGAKRRKHKIKFRDVTGGFQRDGGHPAILKMDHSRILDHLAEKYGPDKATWGFAIEPVNGCLLLHCANADSTRVFPEVGGIAMRYGCNMGEIVD